MDEKGMIQKFSETYGPHAFGLVTLLLIWFVIVKPELAARQMNFERQQKIVDEMSIVASTLDQTADTIAKVADALGKTSSILQMTTESLSKVCDDIHNKPRGNKSGP